MARQSSRETKMPEPHDGAVDGWPATPVVGLDEEGEPEEGARGDERHCVCGQRVSPAWPASEVLSICHEHSPENFEFRYAAPGGLSPGISCVTAGFSAILAGCG